MLGYTLFFFSTDYSFTQFTPENMQKVVVSLIGIVVDMVLVCSLKQTEIKEFNKIESLTRELHKENEILQYMSMTDALTGIRNRMALRHSYDSYQDHEVTVMMLDINDFKLKNDTYGHDEGDRVLVETGKLLSNTFGEEHCYRYGGDEFLVIVPDISETEFKDKLENMKQNGSVQMGDSEVSFSAGYTHAFLKESGMLRELISEADERMYKEKQSRR